MECGRVEQEGGLGFAVPVDFLPFLGCVSAVGWPLEEELWACWPFGARGPTVWAGAALYLRVAHCAREEVPGSRGRALADGLDRPGGQCKQMRGGEPPRADLRKVSDKVKLAEGSIVELQTEVGALRKQMVQVISTVGMLEGRLEDSVGRSRQNNVRLLGFPERAEGAMVEGFVERWIKHVVQPVGLSAVFVVERAHRALVVPPLPRAPPRAIIAIYSMV
ncbi:hypothetical protein NDU88_004877 [Pleurodeles waltl]|uniref:Uncharacterized protein n=1 Tax=Pleurodeles waltl TaxID=8319 RepID=A0AAV7TSS8_PLEWA|nr:hypothetical protein NDU88_004877 [Pleurodeles waltl]